MENEEKKKKGIGKKVVLWIIGVIIVFFIIGCLDEDTTPTSSDIVGDSGNNISSTNNVREDIPSYIVKSDKGIRGAEFSFNLEEFIETYNNYMDKEFSGLFKINLSDFKDITEEIDDSKVLKRYWCNLPMYNPNSSDVYALYVDYYSDNNIGSIVFITNSKDIAAGGVVSRIFQAVFNMPKETVSIIKSNNEKGDYNRI